MNARVIIMEKYLYTAKQNVEKILETTVEYIPNTDKNKLVLGIHEHKFRVITFTEIREGNKGVIFAKIQNEKKINTLPVLVVAKFIAKDIAEEMRIKNINYIDIAGNGNIKAENLLFYVRGQKNTPIPKVNKTRAFQEAGIKLIYQFLTDPTNLEKTYRELAKLTGIALGSVSSIVNELEELNFILKSKNGIRLKNKLKLLERWVIAYNEVLKPKLFQKKLKFATHQDITQWQKLITANDEILWGGEPAANILTGHLNPAEFTIYTFNYWTEIAKVNKLIPDNEGNIEIISAFWPIQTFDNRLATVHPLLVYADLINTGNERNIEAARIIYEKELQYLE